MGVKVLLEVIQPIIQNADVGLTPMRGNEIANSSLPTRVGVIKN